MTFAGCSDFLQEDVRGQENLDTYFQTEEEAESFLTGCYSALTYGGWWQINKLWLLSEMCSDDCWMGNTAQDQGDYISVAHYQGNGQSNEAIANFWQYRYKGILRCNIAIERIPEASILDKEKQSRLVAEARFLRAFYYFYLTALWDNVPLVLNTSSAADKPMQASADEVLIQIEEDLEDAITKLPSTRDANNYGRPTKGAAYGLLAKAYAQHHKWEDAKRCLEWLVDGEGKNYYTLVPNWADNFSNYTEDNKESLYEIHFSLTNKVGFDQTDNYPVSYTHLTLPTILRV